MYRGGCVVAALKEPSTRVDGPVREIAKVFDDDNFLPLIDVAPHGVDPAASRWRCAQVLVEIAGGRREPVEELRLRYLQRLHRASDDFDATEGLRVVEAALSLIPRPEDPGVERHRTRQLRRRWWGRRRRTR
jgi:hypothetical protein